VSATGTLERQVEHQKPGLVQRVLDLIERVGNKVPHPAILFLALCGAVIVLSQILAWAGVSASGPSAYWLTTF
jgi:aminobenzoyl-glutamate transport protein